MAITSLTTAEMVGIWIGSMPHGTVVHRARSPEIPRSTPCGQQPSRRRGARARFGHAVFLLLRGARNPSGRSLARSVVGNVRTQVRRHVNNSNTHAPASTAAPHACMHAHFISKGGCIVSYCGTPVTRVLLPFQP